MGVRAGTLQTIDMSADPQTSYVIDIPDGHTVAAIAVVGGGLSVSGRIEARLSSGGTPVSIGVRRGYVNSANDSTDDLAAADNRFILTGDGTTGLHGTAQVWNLNTAAPVVVNTESLTDSYYTRAFLYKSIVPYSQLYFFSTLGGTMNAGTIYIQSYQRENTVVTKTFSTDSSWDLTGLTVADASVVVFAGWDVTLADAVSIKLQVSTDGISYDAGAADYLWHYINATFGDGDTDSWMHFSQGGLTANGFCGVVMGAPLLAETFSQAYTAGVHTSMSANMATREVAQVDTALRLLPVTGNINSGTAYAVKYAY